MNYKSKSIRTFIGAKDYNEPRSFYRALDFEEIEVSDDMCLFKVNKDLAFYLQDYYVKDWVNNLMLLLEVEDIKTCEADLLSKNLTETYKNVRISPIKEENWGKELFVHDPSGVLWHFAEFS